MRAGEGGSAWPLGQQGRGRYGDMSDAGFVPTHEALTFLLSPAGGALLAELADVELSEKTLLRETTRLRKTYPPDIVAAALEQAALRCKGTKFARAGDMFFTRQALEQASAEVVSRYRARRFAGARRVFDLGCGIGGDALGLATLADVVGIDRDLIRLRMAVANVAVYGVAERFDAVCADVLALPFSGVDCFWADPGRREGARRVFTLADYAPALPALLDAVGHAAGGVKLSPGVDYRELDAVIGATPYEIEILSVSGECREAVLWLGDLKRGERRATLLPGEHTLEGRPAHGLVPVANPQYYLYEPDGAVVRAHLVENLALMIDASKLDEEIAYLTSNALTSTPFAVAYIIDEWMPFNLKKLNRRLRELDIGELIIKKRGFPVDPEQFRRRLRYGGGQRQITLVLTHAQGQPVAILCRRVAP
jgi:SAM-dependent methyltransferase